VLLRGQACGDALFAVTLTARAGYGQCARANRCGATSCLCKAVDNLELEVGRQWGVAGADVHAIAV